MGTCVAGWGGTPTRLCNVNGWGAVTTACQRTRSTRRPRRSVLACRAPGLTQRGGRRLASVAGPRYGRSAEIVCANGTYSSALYPQAVAGATAIAGTCVAGFGGSPLQNCSLAGAWSSTYGTACARTSVGQQRRLRPCRDRSFAHGISRQACSRRACLLACWLTRQHALPCRAVMCQHVGCLRDLADHDGWRHGVWRVLSWLQWQPDAPVRDHRRVAATGRRSVHACVRGCERRITLRRGRVQRSNAHACHLRSAWPVGTAGPWPGRIAENDCAPYNDGAASWGSTPSNTVAAVGTCNAGYVQVGTNSPPTRSCNVDLTWGAVTNECLRACCDCKPRCRFFWTVQAPGSRAARHASAPGAALYTRTC